MTQVEIGAQEKTFRFNPATATTEEQILEKVLDEIAQYKRLKAEAEKIQKELEGKVKRHMKLRKLTKMEVGLYSVTFSPNQTRFTVAGKDLKEKYPAIYDELAKESEPTDYLYIHSAKA